MRLGLTDYHSPIFSFSSLLLHLLEWDGWFVVFAFCPLSFILKIKIVSYLAFCLILSYLIVSSHYIWFRDRKRRAYRFLARYEAMRGSSSRVMVINLMEIRRDG